MPFDNTEYIIENLPSRYRRSDETLLLRRILSHFGGKLDSYDEAFESFADSINAETASPDWIAFWLKVLFGWGWFPSWFTTADKRRLYGNFGRHLARRGTARGIELFLRDFGIVAKVYKRPVIWGEFVWGEPSFSITKPLHFIVEIIRIETPNLDACFWGESVYGESFYAAPVKPVSERDIIALLKFQQPLAQEITVFWRAKHTTAINYEPFWEIFGWVQLSWAETPEW